MLYALAVFVVNVIKKLGTAVDRRQKNYLIKKVISNPRHIVVTRLQNIGDMVVFIPTLIGLRELYPQAEILIMGKHRGGIETIKRAPFIDGIVEVGRGRLRDKLRLFRQLRGKGIDIFIVSSQDQGRVPWALLSGAKLLVGFREVVRYGRPIKEKLPFLISLPVEYDYGSSEAENNLKIVEVLGGSLKRPKMRFDWYREEEKQLIDRELANNKISPQDLVVALCPGTKRPAKMWNYRRFSELAFVFHERYGATIVLCGDEVDRQIINQIKGEAPFVKDFACKTSITALGYLFSKVDLVVCVDSGPMHIASAVGTPLVGLFGPGEFSKWQPYSNNSELVSLLRCKTLCSPCSFNECPKDDHRCMDGITVDAVISEAEKVWERAGKSPFRKRSPSYC